MSARDVRCAATAATMAIACAFGALAASPALATSSWWRLDSTAAPTNLPRDGEAQVLAVANDIGEGSVDGASEAVTLSDELPAGVRPIAVEFKSSDGFRELQLPCPAPTSQVVACTFSEQLPPFGKLLMRITVRTEDPSDPLFNAVSVQGGETQAPGPLRKELAVNDAPTPFGVETYALAPEEGGGRGEGESGSFDSRAGSHPFQLTQTLDLDQTLASYSKPAQEEGVFPSAPALPRDLHFKLPAGLVGDPDAVPRCSDTEFTTEGFEKTDLCPADTAIGVASVVLNEPNQLGLSDLSVPVFNLVPAPGEPARFGFEVVNVPVIVRTAVPSGGEYAVEASVENASEAAQILSSQVTLWGVPGDTRHDQSRGWECLGNGAWLKRAEPAKPCKALGHESPTAFLSLPTSCERAPVTTMSGDSWPLGNGRGGSVIEQGPSTSYEFPSALTGCGQLPFEPSLDVQPETTEGATPTGLDVGVDVSLGSTLSGSPEALAEADVRKTTVTLPEGLQVNPSAANGLEVCSAFEFGFAGASEAEQTANAGFSPEAPNCPDASKVGTVSIETPLLEAQQVNGSVYLAEQNTNPFQPPLVLYLVAEDPTAGVLVKLAGTITPNMANGQLESTFENTPQLPFSHLRLHFFGGDRASVSTPPKCGSYSAAASFTAWSGSVQQPRSEPPFAIGSGPNGSSCSDPLRFAPAVKAGASVHQAGALSPFTLTLGHPDADQPLESVDLRLPPGISALISQVTQCSEAQALANACPPGSVVGHVTAVAGLGGEPVTLGGVVYLTGALKATASHGAAPFGLLAVTRAAVGPFDLGSISVFSTLSIDPATAAVTVQSEPIPKLVRGVPAQLKELQVTVERPGDAPFQFNPTNCDPMAIAGTLRGYEGANAAVSYPFQVENCQSLPFKPVLKATTQGHASKANGASFVVKVTSAGLGQANIAKVDLQLPKALPARLTTIQKACIAAVFQANPATCPEGSNIGTAVIHTPVINSPVTGPAYLVSHGNAAFPDVEFVLQGEGVTLVLDGKTDIKKGITYSKFESAPDEPFTTFETTLPAGPHSALTANVPERAHFNLCGQNLVMPTTIMAQSGKVIEQKTKIAIGGCGAVKSSKSKRLTRKQKLARALKTCRHRHKRSKARRQLCERRAQKAYAPRKHESRANKTSRTRSS